MADSQDSNSSKKSEARKSAPRSSGQELSSDEVSEEIIEIIEQVPREQRARVLQRVSIEQSLTAWEGPLPPPSVLKEFADISPDFPERIMKSFEAQMSHRQDLERLTIRSDVERSSRGQWFGLIIMLAGLAVAAYVVREGESVFGFLTALAFLVGQVGTFVYGTRSQKAERARKRRVMTGEHPEAPERDIQLH